MRSDLSKTSANSQVSKWKRAVVLHLSADAYLTNESKMNDSSKPFLPVALTIAGSDSGGGAGIQADLRTFSFHRVHGTSAITCVTAQNTTGVSRVDALPPESVVAQIDAVTSDFEIGAAKLGMLFHEPIIAAVADRLSSSVIENLVVDPVMVSRSGDSLIDEAAVAALRNKILPLADVLTPNVFEAQLLSGVKIETIEHMKEAAKAICDLGPNAVLVKGGAMSDEMKAVDVWFHGKDWQVLRTEWIDTPNTHGTGCTLSAAIAANLALGHEPFLATKAAKDYVTEALKHSLSIGKRRGPVGHGFELGPPNPP